MPFLAHSSTQQRAYSNYFLPFLHTAAHSSGLSDDWRLHKLTPNIYLQPGGLKSSRLHNDLAAKKLTPEIPFPGRPN